MRLAATLTALAIGLLACGDSEEGGPPVDASLRDAQADADSDSPTEGCPYTERTVLLNSAGQVAFGPLKSTGDFLYYLTEGAVLTKMRISAPAPEALARDVTAFLVDGDSLFYASSNGGIGEVEGPLMTRTIVQNVFTPQLAGSRQTLYFCDQNMRTQDVFLALDVDSGSVVSIDSPGALFACVLGVGNTVYWPAGISTALAATRLVRGGLGQGVTNVVDWPEGFNSFHANQESFALSTRTGLVVGSVAGGEPGLIPLAAPTGNLVLSGEHVFFITQEQCRPDGTCAQSIQRGPLEGGAPELIQPVAGSVLALEADESCVYWIEEPAECALGGSCVRLLVAAPVTPLCTRPGGGAHDACADAGTTLVDAGPPPEELECGDAGELFCIDQPPSSQIAAFNQWSMFDFGLAGFDQIAMQPIVTKLDDDNGSGAIDVFDSSSVVVSISTHDDVDVFVAALRGDGGGLTWAKPIAGLSPTAGLAAGDIDADGFAEIIGVTSSGLVALEHDGTEKWRSGSIAHMPSSPTPALADMDGDGDVEIIVGRAIVNAIDGSLLRSFAPEPLPRPAGKADSLAVDLDLDGVMELVLGNAAYALDGTLRWSRDDRGGYVAVANFDQDDEPEIVVVGFNTVTLLDTDGDELWSSTIDDGAEAGAEEGGPPVVADFDGDALPEIGVASTRFYSMFDADGQRQWQVPVLDNSGFTGSIAFDFDSDGSAEVVHAGTTRLSGLSGIDGSTRFALTRESMTGKQSVTIADINNDGRAEMLVPWDGFASSRGGIEVYAGDTWPWAARAWNQYDYSLGNAFENGKIPSAPEVSWLTHNTFRTAGVPLPRSTRTVCECQE
jgi:hypothetical protein